MRDIREGKYKKLEVWAMTSSWRPSGPFDFENSNKIRKYQNQVVNTVRSLKPIQSIIFGKYSKRKMDPDFYDIVQQQQDSRNCLF